MGKQKTTTHGDCILKKNSEQRHFCKTGETWNRQWNIDWTAPCANWKVPMLRLHETWAMHGDAWRNFNDHQSMPIRFPDTPRYSQTIPVRNDQFYTGRNCRFSAGRNGCPIWTPPPPFEGITLTLCLSLLSVPLCKDHISRMIPLPDLSRCYFPVSSANTVHATAAECTIWTSIHLFRTLCCTHIPGLPSVSWC